MTDTFLSPPGDFSIVLAIVIADMLCIKKNNKHFTANVLENIDYYIFLLFRDFIYMCIYMHI